jgi:hypothetical protein
MQSSNNPARRRAQASLPREHFLRAWGRQVAFAHRAVFPGPSVARERLELFANHNPLLGLGPSILVDWGLALLDAMAARSPAVTARLRGQIRIERKSAGAAR